MLLPNNVKFHVYELPFNFNLPQRISDISFLNEKKNLLEWIIFTFSSYYSEGNFICSF
jgi:hypothetical protein